jgi:hypothetical protein
MAETVNQKTDNSMAETVNQRTDNSMAKRKGRKDRQPHISSFFSETTGPIGTKLSRNVPWMVLYKVSVFRSSRIFNMAARANNML